ncbi:MAG: metallophosphoesterase [Candidatus Pacearchaeota archaeon]|nr:metallophosphoesterase [Candidatus Pacearchaeota archaeon]
MKRKLKILAAGDIHGDSDLTKRLAERAERENVDFVILAGDILSPFQTKNILKPFKDKNKKVLLLPGNHESLAEINFLAELYGMRNIHGYSIKAGDVGIFGAGGALDFNTSEKELYETLKKGNSALKGLKKKIMITHMHSAGTMSEFSGIEGSRSIRKAIENFKPDILIHSHIHEAEGIEEKIGKTRVINVGRKGRIIEL